tara:strand:- start:118 stop:546 length:429 start_codon:yes stop_codon:yes gene_type:complete
MEYAEEIISTTIRSIETEDYQHINKWWIQCGEEEPPSPNMLPDNGLGGVIIEKNNKPIAAMYLYLTNSAVGYIANAIADPNYKSRDRFELITRLIDECVRRGAAVGCSMIWATSRSRGIIERCKELNYEISEQPHHIITKYI